MSCFINNVVNTSLKALENVLLRYVRKKFKESFESWVLQDIAV